MTDAPAMPARRRRARALAPPALALAAALTATAAAPLAADGVASLAHRRAASPFNAADWSSTAPTDLSLVRATIGATQPSTAGLTGAGVGVALIDTGVVPVPGLPASQIVNGPDLSYESQSSDLRYLDTYGHGTHLAGIIAGNDPTSGFRGIAPGVKLTSIKVGTANGAVDASQVIASIDWVIQHRHDDPANPIKVINLAYGTSGQQRQDVDPLDAAVEHAWQAGIVVVAAAGNAGSVSSIVNPAYDLNIITVGSSETSGTPSAADDDMSDFTVTQSKYKFSDLFAPGRSIVSLRNPGSAADLGYPTARVGDTLFRGSGTSQSSAVISGGIALLLQARPNLTPAQVKQLTMDTATRVPYKTRTTDFKTLNVAAALAAATPTVSTKKVNWSSGGGALEAGRGGTHTNRDGKALTGEVSIFGPFSTSAWNTASTAGTAWQGGVWMGYRLAGDGWTGTSWASKTWASATWTGTNWAGTAWTDDNWSGRYWNGRYWNASNWNGRYWSSDSWSVQDWA